MIKFFFLVLISLSAFSIPQKTTVYFLSSNDISILLRKNIGSLYAVNALELKCQKMGEYCFDPQVGLYKPNNREQAVKLKDENVNSDERLKKVRGLGADGFFNQNMINCDKNKFYDVYCNKTGKIKNDVEKRETFEVWVDTSKVMSIKDSEPLETTCNRSNFLNLLESTCTKNNTFRLFSISSIKKRLGKNSQACQKDSSNIDINKLKSWIKKSKSKRVFIFLDEFYAQGMLLSFLKTKSNIEVKGIETKVSLSNMDNEIADLKRYCN